MSEQEEISRPSRFKRIFSGSNGQAIIAVSALLVSICALYISVVEIKMMRTQQRSMVYPHLDLGISYNSEGFRIELDNDGTGLAFINSVEVFSEDSVLRSWPEIIDFAMPEGHNITYAIFGTQQINNQVIPANTDLDIFKVNWNEETRILEKRLDIIEIKICYCSIMGDCWEITYGADRPVPSSCKRIEERQFMN